MQTTQLNQLNQWLCNQNRTFLQEQLVDVLAVINLMQSIEYQTSREHFAQQLLTRCDAVDYGQSDFMMALLASDYVAQNDHHTHQGACQQYRQLLSELISDQAAINHHQLQSFKAAVNGDFKHLPVTQAPAATIPKQDMHAFVDRSLQTVETTSCFGHIKPTDQQWLCSQCDAIMVWASRRYDLPLALRALRAKHYLDRSETLAVTTTRKFIALQQCMDGSFGDYASCLQAITHKHNAQQAQIEFNIKIKLAMQVLWTAFEVDHQQNLLSLLATRHNDLFNPSLPQVVAC